MELNYFFKHLYHLINDIKKINLNKINYFFVFYFILF